LDGDGAAAIAGDTCGERLKPIAATGNQGDRRAFGS
jgi:hypothetical protein